MNHREIGNKDDVLRVYVFVELVILFGAFIDRRKCGLAVKLTVTDCKLQSHYWLQSTRKQYVGVEVFRENQFCRSHFRSKDGLRVASSSYQGEKQATAEGRMAR